MNPLENLALKYYQLFGQLGVNPIYFFVPITILLIVQRDNLKNWKVLASKEKIFLIFTIIGFILFGMASLIHILLIV